MWNPFKLFDELRSDVAWYQAKEKEALTALVSAKAEMLKMKDDIKSLLGNLAEKEESLNASQEAFRASQDSLNASSAAIAQAKAALDAYVPVKLSKRAVKDLKAEVAAAAQAIETAKQKLA